MLRRDSLKDFKKSEIRHPIGDGEIIDLLVDRRYIFAIFRTNTANNDYLIDIFDADSKEYVNSAIFPFVPLVIKNGCAYTIAKNEEGFAVVEKYKINPVVYGEK